MVHKLGCIARQAAAEGLLLDTQALQVRLCDTESGGKGGGTLCVQCMTTAMFWSLCACCMLTVSWAVVWLAR
jgi:hypothetical protein